MEDPGRSAAGEGGASEDQENRSENTPVAGFDAGGDFEETSQVSERRSRQLEKDSLYYQSSKQSNKEIFHDVCTLLGMKDMTILKQGIQIAIETQQVHSSGFLVRYVLFF